MYVGQSFITGSYAYGTPGRESDMDLVVFMDKATLAQLETMSDALPKEVADDKYEGSGGKPLRFGLLNLICVTDKPRWQCWLDGTRKLQKIQPVQREDACEFFKKLRKERDLYQQGSK